MKIFGAAFSRFYCNILTDFQTKIGGVGTGRNRTFHCGISVQSIPAN